jgi:hypothetical protein
MVVRRFVVRRLVVRRMDGVPTYPSPSTHQPSLSYPILQSHRRIMTRSEARPCSIDFLSFPITIPYQSYNVVCIVYYCACLIIHYSQYCKFIFIFMYVLLWRQINYSILSYRGHRFFEHSNFVSRRFLILTRNGWSQKMKV